jgi:hypothetical protein
MSAKSFMARYHHITASRHRLRRACRRRKSAAPPASGKASASPTARTRRTGLDIGADRIGRIVEGQSGALAGFGRWRQRHRADLQEFRFNPLEHSAVAVSLESRFFFSIFSEAMTPFSIACMVGPLSAVSVKNGRMLMRFGLVPDDGVDIGVRMRAVGAQVIVPDDAHIAISDDRADRLFAFERPAAVAEKLRILLERGRGLGCILVHPPLALGEAVRR